MTERAELAIALESAKRIKRSYDIPNVTLDNEQMRWEISGGVMHVAIAGSGTTVKDIRDWMQNFSTFWSRKFYSKHKATLGYVNGARSCIKALMKVKEVRMFKGPWEIEGHSKGGPQADIAGVILRHEYGVPVRQIRTFGSPKYSRQEIDHPLIQRSIRYITPNDPVPLWPPKWWMRNWQHQGQERLVGEDNEEFGLRDEVEAHLIPFYIESLEALV